MYLSLRLCLLALAAAVGITTVSSAMKMDLKFTQNIKRAQSFKCKLPQPRAFSALDLLLKHKRHSEYIIPPMTVLHRCDSSSGCCLQGEHMLCMPLQQENVTLNFQLIDMVKGPRIVSVSAVNHTECGCGLINLYSPGLGDEHTADLT